MRIVKIKDLANTIAAALFCPLEAYIPKSEVKVNGNLPSHDFASESQQLHNNNAGKVDVEHLRVAGSDMASSQVHPEDMFVKNNCGTSHLTLR